MNWKFLFIVCAALIHVVSSRPSQKKALGSTSEDESESEIKVREKRKYEIPLLRQLEESGVGVKKSLGDEKTAVEATPPSIDHVTSSPLDDHRPRVKKQSPSNIGGCGKTVCGPVVSARGSVANDVRSILQSSKPVVSLGDLHSSGLNEMRETGPRLSQFSPVQSRTIDSLMGLSPLSVGYGAPAVYAAAPAPPALPSESSSLGYGHSFFKPPSMPTIPAVAVISQHPPHSLVHPWLVPHLLPHVMPHLMPTMSTFFAPHRIEPQRFPEPLQNDVKQPVPAYFSPSYVSADSTLLCQPFKNTRLDYPYDYLYKPDLAIDKSLNVTEANKKFDGSSSQGEDEKRIHEHLRKVNEIKEEISQLNRAAQRIVDQQERLTEMQQKQLWGSSNSSPVSATNQITPYMGSGYYAHPGMPWGFSRSNILSYPNSHDDIEFFFNLLRAGKKIGLISDSFQPSVLSTVGDALKGTQGSATSQKDSTGTADSPLDNKAPAKPDKNLNQ